MAKQVDRAARAQMMLNDPIEKLIPRMAVPTIVAQLITVVYNLVDTYFVSSLGTNAAAAVGINAQLEQVMNLAATLVAVGMGSYISRLLGAKNDKKASQILSTSFFTGIFFSILVMIVGFSATTWLVNLLGADDNCRQYAIDYATYVLWAAPFLIGSFILNQSLRSEGSATFAMVGIGFGAVLNCFLDPIFIRTLGLGVAGASMATAISKLVSFCILLYPYITKRSVLTISPKNITYNWPDIKEVVSISSSSFFRMLLQIFSGTLMNRIAREYSTSVLAAVSVGNRVMRFPFAIVMGFSQGYLPVVGFNWGAKKYDRAKRAFTFSTTVAFVGAIIMGAVLAISAKWTIGLFTVNDDELLNMGARYMRFECATLMIHAVVAMVNMFYSGIGRPKEALLMGTARQGYCLIPMLLILPRLFGADGITCAQAAADVLSLAVGVPFFIKAVKLLDEKTKEQNLAS